MLQGRHRDAQIVGTILGQHLDQLFPLTQIFSYLRLLACGPLLRDPEFMKGKPSRLRDVHQHAAPPDDGGRNGFIEEIIQTGERLRGDIEMRQKHRPGL